MINVKKRLVIIATVFVLCLVFVLFESCHNKMKQLVPDRSNSEAEYYVLYQENYDISWDSVENDYLLKIAEYHGGTVEDRAYTIIVTLNKMIKTNTHISDLVLHELYEVDKITSYEYEEIVPSDMTIKAMEKVLYERFDNTNGSTDYIEFGRGELK